MSKHKITKISDVQQPLLLEFYKRVYFNRYKNLINNWRWWYRSDLSQNETLILSLEEKIIGQAGLQPVKLIINGKEILADWFLDFAILPEFRGKGFGKILTKKLMETCPNLITFCNHKTLKIVRKLGWQSNSAISRLARPINPLKFIPVIKNFNFGDQIFRKLIKKKFTFKDRIEPREIINNYIHLRESFNKRNINIDKNFPFILRDEEWLNWRLLECPYKKDLYFFEYKNNFSIVHIFFNKGVKRMNILFSYSVGEPHEPELFGLIMNWAINNNIDLVWAIKKDDDEIFKDIFPKKFKKPLTYASWSSTTDISLAIKNEPYNSEGIDSDIDIKMFAD